VNVVFLFNIFSSNPNSFYGGIKAKGGLHLDL